MSVYLQVSHSEAESLKRQDALILEEDYQRCELDARNAVKAEADRIRKARKKEKRKVWAMQLVTYQCCIWVHSN